MRRLAPLLVVFGLVLWVLMPSAGDYAGAVTVVQAESEGGGACPAPGGDRVTMAELADLTRAAGFGEFGGDTLQVAVATFWHESAQGQVKVRNASGSGAAGLAQIMPANVAALGGDPDDPVDNLRMAKELADERARAGRDPLGPWVSYTSGAYQQYMAEAGLALSGPAPVCVVSTAVVVDGSNGQLDAATLCRVSVAPMSDTMALLQCPAAAALDALAIEFERSMGKKLCYGNGYRSLEQQITLARTKPGLAAKAGTSNHGWGLAVDLCGGINSFSTPEHRWMVANAGRFGWVLPSWAQRGGSRPEPWHWEFGEL